MQKEKEEGKSNEEVALSSCSHALLLLKRVSSIHNRINSERQTKSQVSLLLYRNCCFELLLLLLLLLLARFASISIEMIANTVKCARSFLCIFFFFFFFFFFFIYPNSPVIHSCQSLTFFTFIYFLTHLPHVFFRRPSI